MSRLDKQALQEFLDDSVGFPALKILGERHLHAVEDGAPEVSQSHVLLNDVPLVIDPVLSKNSSDEKRQRL